jgi:hypothetical protein
MPRKIAVIEQIRDIRWKERHDGYGLRWIAESAISSITEENIWGACIIYKMG